jgi:hypothetical protein
MEASDFSGYSSWGDERQRRDVEEEDHEDEDDDYSRRGSGNNERNTDDFPEGVAKSPTSSLLPKSLGKATAAAVARASSDVDDDRVGLDSEKERDERGGKGGKGAKSRKVVGSHYALVSEEEGAGGVRDTSSSSTLNRGLSVPPDDREDLTLREPESFSAEVRKTD